MSASFEITGLKELQKRLATLPDRVQRKAMRPAVSAGATMIVRAQKSKAPRESGLLKKSIGKKIVTNKKTQSVTAVIGPRKSVTGEYKGKLRKPSRYAHLADKGFIDESGEHHPGNGFVTTSLDEAGGQALNAMTSKLGDGIEKEAAK
jgi:HK97 gp10 family phage protein